MKYLQYLIPAAFLALAVWACVPASQPEAPESEPAYASAYEAAYWRDLTAFTTDTVNNAETLTYSIGSFNRPIAIELQISGDSISGSTAVTVNLQQSINGSDWYTLGSAAINGTGTTNTRITTDVLGGTLRATAVGTGTQATVVAMDAIVAESQPTQ